MYGWLPGPGTATAGGKLIYGTGQQRWSLSPRVWLTPWSWYCNCSSAWLQRGLLSLERKGWDVDASSASCVACHTVLAVHFMNSLGPPQEQSGARASIRRTLGLLYSILLRPDT